MKRLIYIFFLCNVFYSCQTDLDYQTSGYTQKIIVEGFISDGTYPNVYLSLNIPLSQKVDSTNIRQYVISKAKVTVSDGINSEILTVGLWSNKQFPYIWYKGTSLIGESGKTYYLTIEYGGYTLHSQTTIPHKTKILELKTAKVVGDEKLRALSMVVPVDSTRKNSFRIASWKPIDADYIQTPFLFNSELNLSGNKEFIISPHPTEKDRSYSEGAYFKKGEEVLIQLTTIDSVATQFFKDLTLTSSSNLFIGEKDALKSNISLPGFGIWYGKSVTDTTFIVPQ